MIQNRVSTNRSNIKVHFQVVLSPHLPGLSVALMKYHRINYNIMKDIRAETSLVRQFSPCTIRKLTEMKENSMNSSASTNDKFAIKSNDQQLPCNLIGLSQTPDSKTKLNHLPKNPAVTDKKKHFEPQISYTIGLKLAGNKANGFYDAAGYYIGLPGEYLALRYEIIESIGKGSFGEVFKVQDHELNVLLAIKVSRSHENSRKSAEQEQELLEQIKHPNIIKLLRTFTHGDHLCLVLPLHTQDLYNFIQLNKPSLTTLRHISRQLLESLSFLHNRQITHCDLKPENILISHDHSVKIIDFGSAMTRLSSPVEYLQSRYYRAPEIALKLPLSSSLDIWSFGCILFELSSGFPLFPASGSSDLIPKILSILGLPPRSMFKTSKHFGTFSAEDQVFKIKSLLFKGDPQLLDLIERCVKWDSAERISAASALAHPFLSNK